MWVTGWAGRGLLCARGPSGTFSSSYLVQEGDTIQAKLTYPAPSQSIRGSFTAFYFRTNFSRSVLAAFQPGLGALGDWHGQRVNRSILWWMQGHRLAQTPRVPVEPPPFPQLVEGVVCSRLNKQGGGSSARFPAPQADPRTMRLSPAESGDAARAPLERTPSGLSPFPPPTPTAPPAA